MTRTPRVSDTSRLIGTRETARRLGVHENTVRNMAEDGRLTVVSRTPSSRFKKFDPDEVESIRRRTLGAAGTLEITVPEPYLAVLIGPPGSGKSHLASRNWPPDAILSSDRLRHLICGNPNEQAASPAAFWLLHWITAERLSWKRTTVIDATSGTPEQRGDLVALARTAGVPAAAVVMGTPLAVCLGRNRVRPGPVDGERYGERIPDGWLTGKWAEIAQVTDADLMAEGFAEVVRVPWTEDYQ